MLILNGWICSEDSCFYPAISTRQRGRGGLQTLLRTGATSGTEVKNDYLRLLSASLSGRLMPYWLEHPENNEVPRVCSRYREILR